MKNFLKWLSGFAFVIACSLTLNVQAEGLNRLSRNTEQLMHIPHGSDTDRRGESLRIEKNISKTECDEVPASSIGTFAKPSPERFSEVSIGTAWPLASGYVVTNNHVIEGSKRVVLINTVGQRIPAWTVLRDEVYDIALLKVKNSDQLPPALPLATCDAGPGTDVFTVGYPRVDILGTTPKLSDGVISQMAGPEDNQASYQTTVSIQPGNSGGPLLNMKGEVVGVGRSMLGILDETQGKILVLQHASCAVKVEQVKELLGHMPQKNPVINSLPRHSESLKKLADRVQDSVMIVEAR